MSSAFKLPPDWNDFDDIETSITMSDDDGNRYELACVEAVRQHIPLRLSQMRALGHDPVDVQLRGARPDTMVVVIYRDEDAKLREFGFPLWNEHRLVRDSPHVEHPNALANILTINMSEPGPL